MNDAENKGFLSSVRIKVSKTNVTDSRRNDLWKKATLIDSQAGFSAGAAGVSLNYVYRATKLMEKRGLLKRKYDDDGALVWLLDD